MNAGVLAAAMKAAILAALAAKYADPPDDHQLAGYTFDDYITALSTAIATTVVGHITGNAKCNGLDIPGNNTHNNVGIV